MSTDKLSELKAVADYWRKVKSGELPAPGPNEISITVCTLDGAVSRIAALLAELEAKDKSFSAERSAKVAAWNEAKELCLRVESAEQRIAELEAIRSDASKVFKEIGNEIGCNPDNESIMVAIDDLKATQMTGPLKDVLKRNIELKAKLATPVRFPDCDIDSVSIMAHWYTDNQVVAWVAGVAHAKNQIRAAGFKVEGDE